jgi:hypothetical protein
MLLRERGLGGDFSVGRASDKGLHHCAPQESPSHGNDDEGGYLFELTEPVPRDLVARTAQLLGERAVRR